MPSPKKTAPSATAATPIQPRRHSDAKVIEATGHGFDHWFGLLDRWQATEKTHKEIALWLTETHHVPGWWAQTLTVQYEQERGMRAVHQTARGFEFSVSRTLAFSAQDIFTALVSAKALNRWWAENSVSEQRVQGQWGLAAGPGGLVVTLKEPTKLSLDWVTPNFYPRTRVVFDLYPQGEKTRLTVTHSGLPDQAAIVELKPRWGQALDSLKAYLTGGEPMPDEPWM